MRQRYGFSSLYIYIRFILDEAHNESDRDSDRSSSGVGTSTNNVTKILEIFICSNKTTSKSPDDDGKAMSFEEIINQADIILTGEQQNVPNITLPLSGMYTMLENTILLLVGCT